MKLEIVGGTRHVIVPLQGKGKLYGEIVAVAGSEDGKVKGSPAIPFGGAGVEGRLVMPASLKKGDVVEFEKGAAKIVGKVLALTNDVLEVEDEKPAKPAKAEAKSPEGK